MRFTNIRDEKTRYDIGTFFNNREFKSGPPLVILEEVEAYRFINLQESNPLAEARLLNLIDELKRKLEDLEENPRKKKKLPKNNNEPPPDDNNRPDNRPNDDDRPPNDDDRPPDNDRPDDRPNDDDRPPNDDDDRPNDDDRPPDNDRPPDDDRPDDRPNDDDRPDPTPTWPDILKPSTTTTTTDNRPTPTNDQPTEKFIYYIKCHQDILEKEFEKHYESHLKEIVLVSCFICRGEFGEKEIKTHVKECIKKHLSQEKIQEKLNIEGSIGFNKFKNLFNNPISEKRLKELVEQLVQIIKKNEENFIKHIPESIKQEIANNFECIVFGLFAVLKFTNYLSLLKQFYL
ncbi:hypothetical protein C2G38_2229171 [Gigaspora rosea]|uniref:Uncharacterized protein n=1 Tax=Gigaspora rosea TaxID=44941 RepID=A0A397TV18_9GLOM|nr:hypothetical protein C2G38_2229171 [Gigaspora rosea]